MNKNKILSAYFIHANGFMPQSYNSLFDNIKSYLSIENYTLIDFNKKYPKHILKNWIPIHDDFIESTNCRNNFIGLGHSIGGNIILRSALTNPAKFKAIILLDPTLFVPKIIFFWRLFKYFNFHHVLHPFLKSTLNRKMTYSNYSSLFAAYRNKNIFSKIDDENLTNYINSIVTKRNNHVEINYPKQFEYEIYNSGLSADNYIWKNLNKLNIPILILRAENSNAFLPQAANRIKKINKKINIITLKDTTHLFPLEKPDETANHIITFLKKII